MRLFIEFMPCLGDFVTELPVLHALHERIRPLEVEVSVDQPSAGLLADYDWIRRVHVRTGRWESRVSPIASSWSRPFDLLLVLRSNPAIKLTRLLMNARRKLGAEAYDDSLSAQGVVPHRYSIVRQVLDGVPPEIVTRVVLKPERTRDALAAVGLGDGARILCLGPGAGTPRRMWPVERFAELARGLRPDFDGVVVLGSPAETALCDALAAQAGAVSLTGRPLCLVAALLARSSLYLGNDSGLAHLAAAQGCPAVSIGLSDRYYTPWRGLGVPGALSNLQASEVLAFLHEHELVGTTQSRLVQRPSP
jgi:ADP-heptose:LPS heptosyltransferase